MKRDILNRQKLKETIMWTTPAATEMRFGFEVTMYVTNKIKRLNKSPLHAGFFVGSKNAFLIKIRVKNTQHHFTCPVSQSGRGAQRHKNLLGEILTPFIIL
jgi:coenzyme PQQ precursor peptide PqqA